MTKRALICGISGQDGAYLGRFLLGNGYQVFGTSRDLRACSFHNLISLNIRDKITLVRMALTDFGNVVRTITDIEPDEVYNLAGQSSVGLSFQQPQETIASVTLGTLNILEAIRQEFPRIRFYNSASSECFGDTFQAADEDTPFNPRSPYAIAKTAAFWHVANHREAYGLYACSGLLFNHESPLRLERFVTQKIVAAVCRIACGEMIPLEIGNISIRRDWGWAPEYVEAMWRMLQLDNPEDFVIATGETNSLEDFVSTAFDLLNLDWRHYVVVREQLMRPTELLIGQGNPAKAKNLLNWEAQFRMKDVVRSMVTARMEMLSRQGEPRVERDVLSHLNR